MGFLGALGSILGGAGGFMIGGPAGVIPGASLGGSVGGGIDANAANAKQAAMNRDFQRSMSNTAHQREVADLRAAGLNPILSVNHSGASTPTGSTAQQGNPFSEFPASALGFLRLSNETQKTDAETRLIQAQTELERMRRTNVEQDVNTGKSVEMKNLADERLSYQQALLADAQTQVQLAMKNLVEKQTLSEQTKSKLMSGDLQIQKAALLKAKNEGEIDQTEFGRAMRYLDRATTLIHGIKQSPTTIRGY